MIERRNLSNSLVSWIMNQLSLGPGIGEVAYLVPETSSTSNYRRQLEANGVSEADTYTSLAAAYAATTGYRNDVILAMPGAYDETASLTWAKPNTHILGCGGPNTWGDNSEANVCIYTDTTAVAEVINITGQNGIMKNVNIENYGAASTNLVAVKLDKYGWTFENCRIAGDMTSQQGGNVDCGSLMIEYDGMYPKFLNCQIGQDVWSERTQANKGVIIFKDGQTNGGVFEKCRILSRAGTTAAVAMVRVNGVNKLGRGWTFDECGFLNYFATGETKPNQVFYESAASSIGDRDVILHNCYMQGIDAWQDDENGTIVGDMPTPAAAGGKCVEMSE